jgi:methylated-DNA-protein-cysteine methyltransferase-like protein
MPSSDARTERILSRIRRIPTGQVRTYGDIDPQAPRLVGRVLASVHEDLPWQRVVRADGTLPKGKRQRDLLIAERVPMNGDRVDMRAARRGGHDRARRPRPRTRRQAP